MTLRSVRASGYYFEWRDGVVATLLRSKDGEVGQDVQRRAYAVQKRMKRRAGYKTGQLRRGIRVESVRESPIGPYSSVVSTAPHTMVHELGRGPVEATLAGLPAGTTILDAEGGSIRGARVLRFQPKRGASFIFRGRVGPASGTKFMENSVDAAID